MRFAFFLCLALLLLLGQNCASVADDNNRRIAARSSASTTTNDQKLTLPPQLEAAPVKHEGPPSIFEDGSNSTVVQQPAFLDVRINTPHRKDVNDVFNIYPYPVKPPVASRSVPLPSKPKDVKIQVITSGYTHRDNPDKPFRQGGWRWVYCFNAAVKKSGLGVPHTIFSEYQWRDAIIPYICAETRKWNQFEDERYNRYERCVRDYERNHADAEAEAARNGLNPIQVHRRGYGWAQQPLPPGSWWLTCTRKVAGLTYYWQVPMTAAPGEKINVVLTELNALVIEGGW